MQEQRDHHFGRLFGAETIIKSSILFHTSDGVACWARLLDLVFELAKKKPWIREECGWILYRSVYDISANGASAVYVEGTLERLCSHDLARTPEGISIWIAVSDLFPVAQFPSHIWKHNDPLDRRERGALAKLMKESSGSEDQEGKQGNNTPKSSGVWNSKLHFAWDAVLERVCEDTEKDKSNEKPSKSSRLSFENFWTDVVDSE